jgi:MFS family permease
MAVGVNARTAFSLLFPAILGEFGWDRGITAGAFSFGFLVSAVVTPFVGRLMDLRGPRIVVELGVLARTLPSYDCKPLISFATGGVGLSTWWA